MSNLLRPFPLRGVFGNSGYSKWHPNLIAWMQEVYRAVSGDYNVIHLTKDTAVDSIGGGTGTTAVIAWDETATKQPGFRHDVDNNNSRIYVENKGRYMIKANVIAISSGGAGEVLVMRMYPKIGGVTQKYECSAYSYSIGWRPRAVLKINTELGLEKEDYIEIETHVVSTDAGQAATTRPTDCELIVRRIA